jgi:hypothetical protein
VAAEQAEARAAVVSARGRLASAQQALTEADDPAERAAASAELESATAELDRASADVSAADRRRAAIERSPSGRVPVGAAPGSDRRALAAEPGPVASARDQATRAVAFVEEVVPGRSTALLAGLAAAIVALLALVAREWFRSQQSGPMPPG